MKKIMMLLLLCLLPSLAYAQPSLVLDKETHDFGAIQPAESISCALEALRAATDRGVSVKLVIELAQESGGKISFDGLRAVRTAVPSAQVFYWPVDRRKPNASGGYGSMHAKCLVADRSRAIVSGANLTDYALEFNMELGLIVEGSIAARLESHFAQLILRGELIPAP